MSRGAKIGLLVLTLWPLVYFALAMLVMMGTMAFFVHMPHGMPGWGPPRGPSIFFLFFMLGNLFTVLIGIATLVFYVIHAFQNPVLQTRDFDRILWIILLLVAPLITMPVYWYLHIWREGRDVLPPAQTG